VKDVLGVILFAVYCVLVVGLAAGVTWLVVRFTPSAKS
jgi:hypothetical protein